MLQPIAAAIQSNCTVFLNLALAGQPGGQQMPDFLGASILAEVHAALEDAMPGKMQQTSSSCC